MAIYLFKAQFTLTISKPNFHWQYQNPILIGKPNSHWQHQSLILINNIKAQFSSAISKAQLTLALLKTQANYFALFIESPRLSILGKILYRNYFS